MYWVDGDLLAVRSGAVLPLRCVKTNEPIEEGRMKRRALSYVSPWVYALIFVNIFVLLIVYFIVRKQVKVTFGLSAAAKKKRTIGYLGFWAVFLGGGALVAAGIAEDSVAFGGVGALAFVGSLVLLVVISNMLTVKRVSPDGVFLIKGVNPQLLREIQAGEI